LFCVFAAFLVLLPFADQFGSIPPGAFVVSALLIFAYQTLDNLDGKQARKTGTSSPLGECFDHGCDSLTVPMFTLIIGITIQLGPMMTFTLGVLMMSMVYLAHFEAYFTRKLVLRTLNNPTEAQLLICAVLVFTAVVGPEFWVRPINPGLGIMQANELLVGLYFLGSISTCLDFLHTVYKHMASMQISFRAVLSFFSPFCCLMSAGCAWVVIHPAIVTQHPRLYLWTFAWTSSYLTIRLVVQTVCREPYQTYYSVLTPLLICVANAFGGEILFRPFVSNDTMLYAYFVIVSVTLLFLSVSLVKEFCAYLVIRPFTIRSTVLPV